MSHLVSENGFLFLKGAFCVGLVSQIKLVIYKGKVAQVSDVAHGPHATMGFCCLTKPPDFFLYCWER